MGARTSCQACSLSVHEEQKLEEIDTARIASPVSREETLNAKDFPVSKQKQPVDLGVLPSIGRLTAKTSEDLPVGQDITAPPQEVLAALSKSEEASLREEEAARLLQNALCKRIISDMQRKVLARKARADLIRLSCKASDQLLRTSSGDVPSSKDTSESNVRTAEKVTKIPMSRSSESADARKSWFKAHEHAKVIGEGTLTGSIWRPLRRKKANLMDSKYWIEAADPKHRYGSKLVPYYKVWLASGVSESFFTWLDEGGGKDLDLAAQGHPRAKLTTSSVHYCNQEERESYKVEIRDGVLYWKTSGDLVNTNNPGRCGLDMRFRLCGLPCKYIYVVDLNNELYLAKKRKGRFHHSSFLGARPVRAAGGMVVRNGMLLVINASSGHYKPSRKMLDGTLEMFEAKYGLRRDSGYVKVYPSTLRLFGKVHVPAVLDPCARACLSQRSRAKPEVEA